MAASSSLRRKAALSLLVLGLLALGVASEDVKHGGRVLLEEAQPPSARAERLEAALHSLEGKLHSAGLETAAEEDGRSVEDNLMMHVGSESTGDEEPIKLPDSDKIGEEWNAKDQEAYDNEMRRALGTTGYEPQTLGLPVGFLPIDNEEQEEKYAQILVSVMRNLKSGYWDELLAWADSGSTEENPYISPIVEAIEAPLVKELDAEAHKRVSKTVQEIAQKKDLKPAEMKDMRARLLVPLLLRIRARVHKKVETYTVSMIRRIIMDASKQQGGYEGTRHEYDIVSPSVEAKNKPTFDEQMEYALRDIDALYEKGALSERDYNAEKAKLISEWLGNAIQAIGGQAKARRAIRDFLWPPTKTQHGCTCLLPFDFAPEGLGDKPIQYEVCTDIGSPGHAWCAVDPTDGECGFLSTDPRAHEQAGGYGWTRWDWCLEQPGPPILENQLLSYYPHVETLHGCKCRLPYEVYPLSLGGRQKIMLSRCTRYYGQTEDWCATEGACGVPGTPSGHEDSRLSWTHWDKCIGEPAGYLEPPKPPVYTMQNCTCLEEWEFKPFELRLRAQHYRGCVDIDSPGTAWCAVRGSDCGYRSEDPYSGIGENLYGWTHWDVCREQPTQLMKNLDRKILPIPMPFVRTETGCSCKLPFKLPDGSMNYRCTRRGSFAAWCPVNEEDCGYDSLGPNTKQPSDPALGWTRWDRCIGKPPGFLPPIRPRVMTKQGCVCKATWEFEPKALSGVRYTYSECADIGSPNQAWCAVDTELSPHCGYKSEDQLAYDGPGGYGWEMWDFCVEQPTPHPQGLMPEPEQKVKTMQGCTCIMPYHLSPPALGKGVNMTMTTCNLFQPEGDSKELAPFYWCPTEGDCGFNFTSGYMMDAGYSRWDKCVGEPAGYLEPEPVMTEMGCECMLPFSFIPKSVEDLGEEGRAIYTSCTDSGAVEPKSAWCAVRNSTCGRKSKRSKAFIGPGGFGWTHWDFCVKQPAVRPNLLSGQPQLPVPMPRVRTLHGCACKLPFKYAPASGCKVSSEAEDVCLKKGGYMMSGYCVLCEVKEYTECVREDQQGPWCPVDGEECGTKSVDQLAINPVSEGGYGWTHWDHCIGQPAGFMEFKPRKKKEFHTVHVKGGVQSLSHDDSGAVRVEGISKKFEYGPDHDDKEHAKEAAPHESHGKNGAKEERGRDDQVIRKLENQMASSIHKLNNKISQLDAEPASSPASRTIAGMGVMAAAVMAALVQLL